MAQYVLRGDCTVTTSTGPVTLKSGRVIDDATSEVPIAKLLAAGASLTPVGEANTDALASIVQVREGQGKTPNSDPGAPVWPSLVQVLANGVAVGLRGALNLIGFTASDNPSANRVDVTLSGVGQRVATNAALAALPNPGGPTFATVATTGLLYFFDPSATFIADGRYFVSPPTGTGQWVAQRALGTELGRQTSTWFVDPVAGDDENAGNVIGSPLKTIKQLCYRVGDGPCRLVQITLLNNLPSTDPLSQILWRASWDQGVSGTAPGLTIVGQQTTQLTGTVTSAGVPNPATSTASFLADAGVASWTPYVGMMVVMTSGAASGSFAWILKDVGGNTARLTRWALSTGQSASAAPSAGDTYKVVTLTSVPNGLPDMFVGQKTGTFGQTILQNLDIATGIQQSRNLGQQYIFRGSKLTAPITNGMRLQLAGSLVVGAVNHQNSDSFTRADFSGFLNGSVSLIEGASLQLIDVTFQNSAMTVTSNSTVSATNISFFDSSGAFVVTQGAYMEVATSLYGSGVTGTAVSVLRNGRLRIASFTPTLTGATRDILLEGGTTAISPLVASASVPAASALQTWANWIGAPFSGFAMNYKTGACIFS